MDRLPGAPLQNISLDLMAGVINNLRTQQAELLLHIVEEQIGPQTTDGELLQARDLLRARIVHLRSQRTEERGERRILPVVLNLDQQALLVVNIEYRPRNLINPLGEQQQLNQDGQEVELETELQVGVERQVEQHLLPSDNRDRSTLNVFQRHVLNMWLARGLPGPRLNQHDYRVLSLVITYGLNSALFNQDRNEYDIWRTAHHALMHTPQVWVEGPRPFDNELVLEFNLAGNNQPPEPDVDDLYN